MCTNREGNLACLGLVACKREELMSVFTWSLGGHELAIVPRGSFLIPGSRIFALVDEWFQVPTRKQEP